MESGAGKIIFQGCMDHLRPESEVCLLCGCRGEMRVHAYYDRSQIEFIDGRPVNVSLCICRLI